MKKKKKITNFHFLRQYINAVLLPRYCLVWRVNAWGEKAKKKKIASQGLDASFFLCSTWPIWHSAQKKNCLRKAKVSTDDPTLGPKRTKTPGIPCWTQAKTLYFTRVLTPKSIILFNSDDFCPNPHPFSNGWIVGRTYSVGYSVNYVCNLGYRLVGNVSRICLPSRAWSGLPPTCQGIY